MCMPSININVQDIFTPLLSISADIETIKLSVGLYYQMLVPLRTDHSWKCFSNQWKQDRETENPQRRQDRNKRMKMRQKCPLWSGTNVPTKQIINSCNHKRTAMYTLNDLKMLLICYSRKLQIYTPG